MKVERRVGRLVELSFETEPSAERLQAFLQQTAQVLQEAPPRVVVWADALGCTALPPGGFRRLAGLMRRLHPRLVRAAWLVSPRALPFSMQLDRLMREAGHPHPTTFADPAALYLDLQPVLEADEVARLREAIAHALGADAERRFVSPLRPPTPAPSAPPKEPVEEPGPVLEELLATLGDVRDVGDDEELLDELDALTAFTEPASLARCAELPRSAHLALLTLVAARARAVQEQRPLGQAKERLQAVFHAVWQHLTEQPVGHVHGLSREHRPRGRSWTQDAQGAWGELNPRRRSAPGSSTSRPPGSTPRT